MQLAPLVLYFDPSTLSADACNQAVLNRLKADGLQVVVCRTIADFTQHLQPDSLGGTRSMVALLGACTEYNCAAASYLRVMHPELGIVALAENQKDSDVIRLLQSGADNICPPNTSDALLAAMLFRALERTRMLKGATKIVQLGSKVENTTEVLGYWVLSEQNWVITSPIGCRITLTTGERAFLTTLLAAPDMRASHADLIQAVSSAYSLGNHANKPHSRLSVLVSRLRNKCQQQYGTDLPLKSVHRWGYMFSGQL